MGREAIEVKMRRAGMEKKKNDNLLGVKGELINSTCAG